MDYIQRTQMELKSIDIAPEELMIYLEENGILQPLNEYNSQSNADKRAIYKTSLSVLESIANNPQQMKNYKEEDMSVSGFAESIQNRIDQLEKKIRHMSVDDSNSESSFFMLFKG
ncbi:hypothetical protein [Guptibacillus hwajinpoensis]|uniref:hypothetical protein n=1 Tax=Guptibacillus hwajinpoensis TaxID=208199 RepID=UPI00373511A8